MTGQATISHLKSLVYEYLKPLIDRDYVLYGLPYYTNIGDTLIWDGELEFLKNIPHQCLGTCGWNSYPQTPLDKDTIVLITGGGYFGDTWRYGWECVLRGISHLKDNRIIILPNSIYYSDSELIKSDSQFLAGFKDLIICARDLYSYDFACEHFSNKVLMVPDMAFCIDTDNLRKLTKSISKEVLYLKRNDKEFVTKTEIVTAGGETDVRDWPTMDSPSVFQRIIEHCGGYIAALGRRNLIPEKIQTSLLDILYKDIYRMYLTKVGVGFISQYKKIYTTRLHVMILAILLDKSVEFIDNSYGKLGNFFSTWLSDCDIVTKYKA